MMKEYYKDKYRTNTLRLQHWDYSAAGYYFITICIKDKICCLGEIKNNKVHFSEIGKIVFDEWLNTQKLRPYMKLDDFIIMPNHLHGIIIIENNDFDSKCRDVPRHVSTKGNLKPPQKKSLSIIINHFKGAVTRQCNKKNMNFSWQPRFYEHIIESEDDYARIKKYISDNPINWSIDRNNPFNN